MFGTLSEDKIIYIRNHEPIRITNSSAKTYSKCFKYAPEDVAKSGWWHQVTVLHFGSLPPTEQKALILEAIFAVVDGQEFFPIGYRTGRSEDCFYVYDCNAALEKLFAARLSIQLSNRRTFNLQLRLNIGQYNLGQISFISQICVALNMLLQNLVKVKEYDGILNLSKFANNPQLEEVVVYLGNQAVFERVCDILSRDDNKFLYINGIILSDNNINGLSALRHFSGCRFSILDLRNNQISSIKSVLSYLKDVEASALFLDNNPITMRPGYPDILKPIFKNFKFLDGVLIENASTANFSPLDQLSAPTSADTLITESSAVSQLLACKYSKQWHLVLVPDRDAEFTKEQVFVAFFNTLNPEFEEMYPCYYRFKNGEHQFLIRQCYEQLLHLLQKWQLRICIQLRTAEEIISHKIAYYLRLNACPFKVGHVDPLQNIKTAVVKLFDKQTLILNLENFQGYAGLQNVVVDLSLPKVLSTVVGIAANFCLKNCIELRLSKNRISKCDIAEFVNLMPNLKSFNLSYNQIKHLDDIKSLQSFGVLHLTLQGNPLCKDYTFQGTYVKDVKKYFPQLVQLDKVNMRKDSILSPQNYLCDVRGYDFVQKFVTYYFSTYDSNRFDLRGLYNEKSLYTVNCCYDVSRATEHIAKRISTYQDCFRNPLYQTSNPKALEKLHVGTQNIMNVHLSLPSIKHSLMTFKTETTVFTGNIAVINVHGIFNDNAPSIFNPDVPIAFTRIFVLVKVDEHKGTSAYEISNELFSIYNPTSSQLNEIAFNSEESSDKNEQPITKDDQNGMIVMLQDVIQLKTIWCRRFLTEAKWDFERALELCRDKCEKNEIPEQALI